ncbi:hypothetical protein [Embleya scabrispora]|uniref:hypothetical protein n=1 Tax=Embleya scabrispora TaxID=159449 RepID=UPI0013753139|nr:hypothetical protein [Embleya scabrispora]
MAHIRSDGVHRFPSVKLYGSAAFTFPLASARRSFPLGEWMLVPRATTLLNRAPHAHLVRSGECVRLRHCTIEMEQFALSMVMISAAFSRRLEDIVSNRQS